jgi:predicted RecA/RadA family phage recombinase
MGNQVDSLKQAAADVFNVDFLSDAGISIFVFGLWYTHISGYAALRPVEFMTQCAQATARTGIAIDLINQDVFKLAKEVMDDFVEGQVLPAKFDRLKAMAEIENQKVKPVSAVMSDPLKAPTILLAVTFPVSMVEKMEPYFRHGGYVDYPPEENLLLADFLAKLGTQKAEPDRPVP